MRMGHCASAFARCFAILSLRISGSGTFVELLPGWPLFRIHRGKMWKRQPLRKPIPAKLWAKIVVASRQRKLAADVLLLWIVESGLRVLAQQAKAARGGR